MKHMRACCPSTPTLPPWTRVVGVLDQDEAFGGFSSASRRTSTALNHPPVVSLPSEQKGIYLFIYFSPRVKTRFWPPEKQML